MRARRHVHRTRLHSGDECRNDPKDEEVWISVQDVEPREIGPIVTALDLASVSQLANERRFWMRSLFRDRADGVIQSRTHYILDCARQTFTPDWHELVYWDGRHLSVQPERPPMPTRAGTEGRRIEDLLCDDASLAKVRATVEAVRAIRSRPGKPDWASLPNARTAVLEFTSERQ